jgi:hypothetical protein
MPHKTTYIKEIDEHIDSLILPLILEIWNLGGTTFQCCIGNIIEPDNEDDEDLLELMFPWIITNYESLPILKNILGENILHIIDSSNGYMLSDYGGEPKNLCFVVINPIFFKKYGT